MIGDKDASQRCGKIKTWNYIRINGLPQYETNHGVYSVLDGFNVVVPDHFCFGSFQVSDMKLAVVEKAL